VFHCDASLHIARIEGAISDRLECDTSELHEHLWYPFLHRDDWPVVERMGVALAASRPDRYHLRAVSRSGDRLGLTICTFVRVGHSPAIGGSISLVSCDSSRHYVGLAARAFSACT
jgi:hypothetical protein